MAKIAGIIVLFSLAEFSHSSPIMVSFNNLTATITAMDPAETPTTQGSIVNTSIDAWNNISNVSEGMNFTDFALKLANGTASGATMSGNAGHKNNNISAYQTENKDWVMFSGWYGFQGTEILTVANLPTVFTNSGYTVTIYGDSNHADRDMNYTIGGTTLLIEDRSMFSGTFVEGGNYVTFTGLSNANFTISGNTPSPRSSINGIVITAVPEPSSVSLLGLGVLSLILRRRK